MFDEMALYELLKLNKITLNENIFGHNVSFKALSHLNIKNHAKQRS